MLKLLVACDGSPHAQRALEAVARLAREGLVPELDLVNVREPIIYYGELPAFNAEELVAAQQVAQQAVLDAARAQAAALGLAVRGVHAIEGQPGPEIARLAATLGSDQVVMGTHGRGALGHLFMGSVAQRVVQLSAVPVLLVR